LIALFGQADTQAPHFLHFSGCAPFKADMTQNPQPIYLFLSIRGILFTFFQIRYLFSFALPQFRFGILAFKSICPPRRHQ